MIAVRSVAQVRSAEERAFRDVPEGALMQRAAHALSVSCARLITDATGRVVGSRVVLLVGSGNNGGDALWAGALLAARGCRVDAVCLSDRVHAEGAAALRRAGGHLLGWTGAEDAGRSLIVDADIIVDGILGIGGSGGLRPDAADLHHYLEPPILERDIAYYSCSDNGGYLADKEEFEREFRPRGYLQQFSPGGQRLAILAQPTQFLS